MKTVYKEPIVIEFVRYLQGDHLSGTPGNVREFDSCQGNVRNFTKSHGNVEEKILSVKSGLKPFIVSYIFPPFLTSMNLCISFWFQIMHCVAFLPPPLTITLVQA